jgi:rare lipoprotein A
VSRQGVSSALIQEVTAAGGNSCSRRQLLSTGVLIPETTLRRLAELTPTPLLSLIAAFAFALSPRPAPAASHPQRISGVEAPDLSARKRLGEASYYARQFFGKRMADGAPMNPRGNNAASRTLPLGTVAKVTNINTGKSATVRIEDRGPYVKGRIVDLSPATARQIGITRKMGIAKVVVQPIKVPLPDGRIRLASAGPAWELPQVATRR